MNKIERTKKGLPILYCEHCKRKRPFRTKMGGKVCNACNTIKR